MVISLVRGARRNLAIGALLHHAAAVDDAPQAHIEGIDHGGDRREQEHRRDGQLDDAGDVGEGWIPWTWAVRIRKVQSEQIFAISGSPFPQAIDHVGGDTKSHLNEN